MMECELCKCTANMYCESDDAWLCTDCDVLVHAANFLVAKHSRFPLCHLCHSLTPCKASGASPATSLFACRHCSIESNHHDDDDNDDDDDDESQVVPWFLESPTNLVVVPEKKGKVFLMGEGGRI